MYTVFCVHLYVSYRVLYRLLANAKSSSYPSSVALYCRKELRRNITPARLEEIAQLAEHALTLTARAWDRQHVDSKLAEVGVSILQPYPVLYRVLRVVAIPLSNRLTTVPALILVLLFFCDARWVDHTVDNVVNIAGPDDMACARLR
jgi:hypothetical protein